MDKREKAIQLLIENGLMFSNSYGERKNLISIYHVLDGTEEKESKPKQFEWGIVYLGLTGIAVALIFLVVLANR